MTDTDSTAGEPTEPVELPTKQAETPEEQRELDLGFEYGAELRRLETELRKKITRIRSLEHPIGNPKEDLAREHQLAKLENEADGLQHRIDLIKKWFATKPVNLDGIPTDTDTPPADTPVNTPDAGANPQGGDRVGTVTDAPTASNTEPAQSAIIPIL